jgi:GDP-L-fucose synthase
VAGGGPRNGAVGGVQCSGSSLRGVNGRALLAGAPTVTIWYSGQPPREFLAVDDLADAYVFVMRHYSASEFLNVRTGQDMTISECAHLVAMASVTAGGSFSTLRAPDGAPQSCWMCPS